MQEAALTLETVFRVVDFASLGNGRRGNPARSHRSSAALVAARRLSDLIAVIVVVIVVVVVMMMTCHAGQKLALEKGSAELDVSASVGCAAASVRTTAAAADAAGRATTNATAVVRMQRGGESGRRGSSIVEVIG